MITKSNRNDYRSESCNKNIQVMAFQSIFNQQMRIGDSCHEAFAKAVCLTSDEAYERIKKSYPERIKRFEELLGNGRIKRRRFTLRGRDARKGV